MLLYQVAYDWADKYGLLADMEGAAKFQTLTTLTYTPPVCPPATDPGIIAMNLTDKKARANQELNDTAKANYTVVEDFARDSAKKTKMSSIRGITSNSEKKCSNTKE